ncbi:hypothetical protein Pmani_008876 [Petrolisthes manimaculis]|uniref:Uncharacterized protein n=1 Tax=Petrolisthes manimaculis TaxID=1843537 RepID=A0AAE1UE76_9EUCA|nr:hypothetical protein Pmani_008876 [Petrolisthes manimaculis]
MLDHLPGADTPPQSSQRDTTAGDITRSDSYSLSRGGKLVSSRPWDTNGTHVLLNLQTSDTRGRPAGHKQQRRASPSSESSSDSESDSDDTSEDEYELSGGRHQAGLANTTILEEPESCPSQNTQDEDEDHTSGQHCFSCDQNCDNKCKQSGQCGHDDDNDDDGESDCGDDDDNDDDDDDNDDDDDGSESDETESTVKARPEAGNIGTEGSSSKTQGAGDEDHNDTLSTLSDDLSFDDRDDISPLREQEVAEVCECTASDPQRSPSPALPSRDTTTQECPTDNMAEEECGGNGGSGGGGGGGGAEGMCLPMADDSLQNIQRTGVRAGVFCLSGYPRQGEGITTTPLPSGSDTAPSTRHSPASHTPPHHDHTQEQATGTDIVEEKRECRDARRGCGGVQTKEITSNTNHVDVSPTLYNQHTSLSSTPSVLSGEGRHSASYGHWPVDATESSTDYFSDYVPSEHVRNSLQDLYKYKPGRELRESPGRGAAHHTPHSTTQHGNTLRDNHNMQPNTSSLRQHKSIYLNDTNLPHDLHLHQHEQHVEEITRDAPSLQHHQRNQQQQQQLKKREQEESLTRNTPNFHQHHHQHYSHHHPRESPFQENERGRGPHLHLYSSHQQEEEEEKEAEEDPWNAPTLQQRPPLNTNTIVSSNTSNACGGLCNGG